MGSPAHEQHAYIAGAIENAQVPINTHEQGAGIWLNKVWFQLCLIGLEDNQKLSWKWHVGEWKWHLKKSTEERVSVPIQEIVHSSIWLRMRLEVLFQNWQATQQRCDNDLLHQSFLTGIGKAKMTNKGCAKVKWNYFFGYNICKQALDGIWFQKISIWSQPSHLNCVD